MPFPGMSDEQAKQFLAAQEQFSARMNSEQELDRRRMVRFSAVMCSCTQRFNWYSPNWPPQANCAIHSVLFINTASGKVLM